MTERPGAYVDHERTACLCGDGLPGFWAAVCVTATGDDVLWLVSVDELDTERPRHGDANQPHEKLGRLPAGIRDRILPAPRCGRPTHAGTPCRHRVKATGDACGLHAARAAP